MAVELRRARVGAGLSQEVVARAVGTSHSTISRIERGTVATVDPDTLAACCGAVGLELAIRVYRAGDAIRDRAHARLLELHATSRGESGREWDRALVTEADVALRACGSWVPAASCYTSVRRPSFRRLLLPCCSRLSSAVVPR